MTGTIDKSEAVRLLGAAALERNPEAFSTERAQAAAQLFNDLTELEASFPQIKGEVRIRRVEENHLAVRFSLGLLAEQRLMVAYHQRSNRFDLFRLSAMDKLERVVDVPLDFDLAKGTFKGKDPDPERVPVPGERIGRKSAVLVVIEAVLAVAAQPT
ncbi:hypothetical protein [Vulgatibacter sp.]|uniref:hypothetical protein n=1 Tax=Vulgatibacter sp. TaxID=1971226 RepID=UPI0035641694